MYACKRRMKQRQQQSAEDSEPRRMDIARPLVLVVDDTELNR